MNLNDRINEAFKYHKQIVLTGAPGTGKTYGALKYVEQETNNDKTKYQFAQFHPSYDYSDFVEGLRPVVLNGSNDEPTFVRIDGTFKAFCRKIVLNYYYEKERTYWIRRCNPSSDYKIGDAYDNLNVIDWTQPNGKRY